MPKKISRLFEKSHKVLEAFAETNQLFPKARHTPKTEALTGGRITQTAVCNCLKQDIDNSELIKLALEDKIDEKKLNNLLSKATHDKELQDSMKEVIQLFSQSTYMKKLFNKRHNRDDFFGYLKRNWQEISNEIIHPHNNIHLDQYLDNKDYDFLVMLTTQGPILAELSD